MDPGELRVIRGIRETSLSLFDSKVLLVPNAFEAVDFSRNFCFQLHYFDGDDSPLLIHRQRRRQRFVATPTCPPEFPIWVGELGEKAPNWDEETM